MGGVAMSRHAYTVCVELQRFAIRRRDVGLIEAAERLSAEHLANDRDRIAFATRSTKRTTARGRHATDQ
jgi:hypothetical protein